MGGRTAHRVAMQQKNVLRRGGVVVFATDRAEPGFSSSRTPHTHGFGPFPTLSRTRCCGGLWCVALDRN